MSEAIVSKRRVTDRTLRGAALALGAATMAFWVIAMLLGPETGQGAFGNVWGAPFAAVGVLIAYRQPRNPIAWILIATSVVTLGSSDAGMYALFVYWYHHRGLPLARLGVALAGFWSLFLVLLPLPVLLFPDGALPRGRWRIVAWAYGLIVLALISHIVVVDLALLSGPLPALDPTGESSRLSNGGAAFVLAYIITMLAWFVYIVRTNRHADGERRAQFKWMISGGVATVVGFLVGMSLHGTSSPALHVLGATGFLCAFALPISIAVALLKYRLYDIDRVISRTLSYTIVTALLAGTFVGLVLLSTRVLPFSSTVGVAASTLAAAALFNPIRVRVQRVLDRRFNRTRYDAEKAVDAFASALRDAVDLDAVQTDLLAAVTSAVQPAHATVWMREVPR